MNMDMNTTVDPLGFKFHTYFKNDLKKFHTTAVLVE